MYDMREITTFRVSDNHSEHDAIRSQVGGRYGIPEKEETELCINCITLHCTHERSMVGLHILLLLSVIVHKAQHTTRVTTNKKHAMLCIKKRRCIKKGRLTS